MPLAMLSILIGWKIFSSQSKCLKIAKGKIYVAIAQWICLRLPSCRPRFESQAHHLVKYVLLKGGRPFKKLASPYNVESYNEDSFVALTPFHLKRPKLVVTVI